MNDNVLCMRIIEEKRMRVDSETPDDYLQAARAVRASLQGMDNQQLLNVALSGQAILCETAENILFERLGKLVRGSEAEIADVHACAQKLLIRLLGRSMGRSPG